MNKLYIVSLGAGDPELLTLKAYKTIKNSNAICIPTKTKDSFEHSRAYEIVSSAFKNEPLTQPQIPIYTPMKLKEEDWQVQVDAITQALDTHSIVAYLTLGDAGVYSTAYYLLEIIKNEHPSVYESCEVIPGITSFSLASAKTKKPLCLGEEELIIRPFKPKKELTKTTIYMRPEMGMSLDELHLGDDCVLFEQLEMEDEKITHGKAQTIKKYMSLLIDFAKRD